MTTRCFSSYVERTAVLAVTGALTGPAALGAQPASAAAKSKVSTKTACADIDGTTIGLSSRWRIVVPSLDLEGPSRPVLSCRLDRSGPAVVRQLGASSLQREYGQDFVTVRGLVGDRALLETLNQVSVGSSQRYRLIDLSTGTSREIGTAARDFSGTSTRSTAVLASLSPTGALASAVWQTSAEQPRQGGELVISDAAGTRSAGDAVVDVAPSAGVAGTDGGFYGNSAIGGDAVFRTPASGPVRATELTPDPALKETKLALPSRRPSNKRTTRTDLAASSNGLRFELLRTRRVRGKDAARIIVTDHSKTLETIVLAPGGAKELRVLASTPGGLFVSAKFADRPEVRRVRLLSPSYGWPTIDFTTRASSVVGSSPLGGLSSFAVATSSSLRWWTPAEQTATASRPSDLAVSFTGQRLYYRDAAFGPRMLQRAR